MTKDVDNPVNQSKLKADTCKRYKAQETCASESSELRLVLV